MSVPSNTRPTAGGAPAPPKDVVVRPRRSGTQQVVRWLTSTDHKVIGNLYIITAMGFFLFSGVDAMLIRAELFSPGLQVVATRQQYNELFTMHGTMMLLLFATPMFAGFTNAVMPLQIGAPDVAFPRLNMLSYWLFFFGGPSSPAQVLLPGESAGVRLTAYTPCPRERTTRAWANLWVWARAL
jgi:cytochrome c oxidase subunit 1